MQSHRHGPISVGWLQQPRDLEKTTEQPPESRGMALYHPPGNDQETLVIAPLDDGSVCVWDVSAMSDRKGRIVGRSRPGLLAVEGDGTRSKLVSTGVTECISVDSIRNKLYVAVQSSKCHYSFDVNTGSPSQLLLPRALPDAACDCELGL